MLEGRQQECQKLSNDVLITHEHNNKLKEELQKSKDHLKSSQQQHDILAKDLITKLECEEEKQTYLENKIQLLTDQNKTLQRMLEETPVEKLKPDFDQTSENKVLLESLKNERSSKENVQSTLQETLDTLENATKEKEDLAGELTAEKSSMQEALKKLEILAKEKHDLQLELAAERGSNQESQDRVKDLDTQLCQLKEQCDEAVVVGEDLQQQLDDVTSELKRLCFISTCRLVSYFYACVVENPRISGFCDLKSEQCLHYNVTYCLWVALVTTFHCFSKLFHKARLT